MNGNIEKMQSLTGKMKSLAIDTTLTKKGMCAEAKATGEALATKVNITDIVDDLLSVADDKPLSANQGRILKKQIDEIDPHYAENVNYDNTTSGIDAENVQGAIDKLSKAENVSFDNTVSGLNSGNVQGAIDELSDNVADVQTQINDLFTRKSYTVSLTANNHVTPFTMYGKKDISSDVSTYGTPIAIFGFNDNQCPVACAYREASKELFIAGSMGTTYVYVIYSKVIVNA